MIFSLHYNFVFSFCSSIFLFIIIFFLVFFIKKKDKSLWYLTTYSVILFLWAIGWVLHYSCLSKFFSLLGSLFTNTLFLAPFFFILFLYNFPDNIQKKESKIVYLVFFVFSVFYFLFSNYLILTGSLKYHIEYEHFRRTDTHLTDIPYMILIIVQYFWCILLSIRKSKKMKHLRESRALRTFAYSNVMQILLSLSYILRKTGYISSETYVLTINLGGLLILTYIVVTYFNYSVISSTFQMKIIGISLVTILLIFSTMARFIFYTVENSFYRELETLKKQLITSINKNDFQNMNSFVEYIIHYNTPNTHQFIFQTKEFKENKKIASLDFKNYSGKFIEDPKFAFIPFYFYIGNKKYQAGVQYLYYRKNIVHPPTLIFATLILITTLLIIFMYPILFYRNLFQPLKVLLQAIDQVYKGNLNIRIPILVKDEIGFLTKTFNGMVKSIRFTQKKLENYNKNLESSVKERTRELNDALEIIKNEKSKIDYELVLASKIQEGFLPKNFLQYKQFQLAYFYSPLRKVGGDYLDIFQMKDGSIAILIVDVSGHGIPAALLTALAKLTFMEACQKYNSIKEILSKTNKSWMKILQSHYLTAFMIKIFPKHKIEFSCAGHKPMLVYRKSKHILEKWSTEGTFIGIFEDADKYFEEQTEFLKPGDRLLLYTDGITESFDSTQTNMYSEKRLAEIFLSSSYMNIKDALENIKNDWYAFMKRRKQEDDVSLMLIEIT